MNEVVSAEDRSTGGGATMTGLDTETLPPLSRTEGGREPVVAALTILCHADPARIGEQAHLQPLAQGRSAALCRTEPDFRHPGARRGRPLGDPYLSRRPITLRWRDEALVVDGDLRRAGLVVDGVEAGEPVAIGEDLLRGGVVLELGRRVALLLHLLPMPRRPDDDLGLVGHSEAIEVVRREVRRVAPTEIPVLLRGESGTGKELVARAIHGLSERRRGPFVSVNMAAIPSSTAASGLFGHVKGAFTGATGPSSGFFGQADGGTLFLDEVGDTPMDLQVLLLRALESGEVQPVGAQRARAVDVRVIAATETDLDAAVAEGRFRSSFLHRLAGYAIRLPPLRERRDDVARLLLHFLEDELAALGLSHRLRKPRDRLAPPPLDPADVSRLVRYDWPGNVRELRNLARRIAIDGQDLPGLDIGAAFDRMLGEGSPSSAAPPAADDGARRREISAAPPSIEPRAPSSIDAEELIEALRAVGYRPGPAAERLGIGRTTIYKLIDACPAIRKAADLGDDELRETWLLFDGDVERMAGHLEVSVRALKLRLRRFEPPSGRE